MSIELVKQTDEYGCAAACCAMILGKSYADVTYDFLHDFSKKGIRDKKWIEYLSYEGYAVLKKSWEFIKDRESANVEMLKPFAPVHVVIVRQFTDAKTSHSVVMDADGKLFCPAGISDERIREGYFVERTYGFFKGENQGLNAE